MSTENPVPVVYTYTKVVNSDQITREIQTYLAQTNLEWDTTVELSYIETEGEELLIHLSDALSDEQKVGLDETVANHIPQENPVTTLVEYLGNDDALSNGLTSGQFYRTGEFVKVVY